MTSHLRQRYNDLLQAHASARTERQRTLIQHLLDETAEEITRQNEDLRGPELITHRELVRALKRRGVGHASACEYAALLISRLEIEADREAADIIASLI